MTKEEVIDLIRDTAWGMLATVENNQPHVRPMMPYLTDEGKMYVALLGRSRTIGQVSKNPLVEICFVDRKVWYARLTGKAKISTNLEAKEALWNNIPMLKQYFGGVNDADFQMMEIDITEVEAMTPHQKLPEKIKL